MKIGLIGLPNSGKTTIFNGLSRSAAEVTPYVNTNLEPNIAIINVGDERIQRLSELYQPKKTTYATIELLDFIGLPEGSANNGTISGELMRQIKNMDALAVVIRNFQDDLLGEPSPLDDLEKIDTELLLFDMVLTENRLERIEWSYKRGKKTNELQIEEKALRKILEHLNENKPIRNLPLDNDQIKMIRGLQFLTQKPHLLILNSDESNFGDSKELLANLKCNYKVIEFAGKFEMELSRLEDEEAQLFMEDIGIKESARNRLSRFAYQTLGYISFFTVGADEVRAWNIRSGNTAVQAAGAIHTDLMRGFIRAECFSFDDLLNLGSEKAIRDKGRFRLEGKDYVVKDGDILSIRFNV